MQILDNKFTDNTVTEYTECKACLKKFDRPKHDSWCDNKCYEYLMWVYENGKYGKR